MSERERLLEEVLSEGLDICVRARQLDELMEKAILFGNAYGTRSATPALWVQDQYDRDLDAWENKARAMLLPAYSAAPPIGGEKR